jgi:hypothetical protein
VALIDRDSHALGTLFAQPEVFAVRFVLCLLVGRRQWRAHGGWSLLNQKELSSPQVTEQRTAGRIRALCDHEVRGRIDVALNQDVAFILKGRSGTGQLIDLTGSFRKCSFVRALRPIQVMTTTATKVEQEKPVLKSARTGRFAGNLPR